MDVLPDSSKICNVVTIHVGFRMSNSGCHSGKWLQIITSQVLCTCTDSNAGLHGSVEGLTPLVACGRDPSSRPDSFSAESLGTSFRPNMGSLL